MALSAPTTALVSQGDALMVEFQQQGVALHNIAYKQKEIGAKIENMIAKFATHEVMKKPRDTIVILQEVKSSFEAIKNNINTLQAKEKEMSTLIQDIIARQNQGNTESAQINAQLVATQNVLNEDQRQIDAAQANLNNMAAELQQLQERVEEAELRVANKKEKKQWWIVATIVTVGLAGIGLQMAEEAVQGARSDLQNVQQMRTKVETDYNNVKASNEINKATKARLDGELQQKQAELAQIADILNKLQPSLQDTVEYREYLLKLSDAFTQVNSYVQNLEKTLGKVEEIQTAGHSLDESINITVTNDFEHLGATWDCAKAEPAVQTTLKLNDSNNAAATLSAIKTFALADRANGSAEQRNNTCFEEYLDNLANTISLDEAQKMLL